MVPGLTDRYRQIVENIHRLRLDHAPTLIAVSKHQPVDAIEALYHLGHRDFGENYVQELVEKAEILKARGCVEIRWHFIGHLQTNKAKLLIPYVHAVHSVDSERLAAELGKRWSQANPTSKLSCFLEVNIDQEPTKSGVAPSETSALAALIATREHSLKLEGLMAIPSASSTGDTSPAFAALLELERECRPHTAGQLSMGMSGDYAAAIAQGATHIRIGTALFGAREK